MQPIKIWPTKTANGLLKAKKQQLSYIRLQAFFKRQQFRFRNNVQNGIESTPEGITFMSGMRDWSEDGTRWLWWQRWQRCALAKTNWQKMARCVPNEFFEA